MPSREIIQRTFTPVVENSEFIAKPPGWIVRSGATMLALGLVVVLILAYIIQYPDEIQASGIITTENPPLEIKSMSAGILSEVMVETADGVMQGQSLLLLKSSAVLGDIARLQVSVSSFLNTNVPADLRSSTIPDDLQVGEINGSYVLLINQLKELKFALAQETVRMQVDNIATEISEIGELSDALVAEKDLFDEEVSFANEDLSRSRRLLEKELISPQELEAAEIANLQYQRQLQTKESGIIQNKIKVSQLELEQTRLQNARDQELTAAFFNIMETCSRIKEEVRAWDLRYVVRAEFGGEVEWNPSVRSGMLVEAGTTLGYIISSEADDQKIVRAQIASSGLGKVEIGDVAIIRVSAFPYKEFGSLITSVERVTRLPVIDDSEERLYEIVMSLEEGLFTDYGQKLAYRPNMEAEVKIVTDKKSVLERIFENLFSVLKNTS